LREGDIIHWIQNIAIFLIFTAFVGIILPNDKFKGYINLCLGLVLILMILKPLSDFLNTGISTENLFQDTQQSVNVSNQDAYSQMKRNMLQQSLNQQAEAQLSGICADNGFELVTAQVQANTDYTSLQAINITVRKNSAGSRPFIYIEPSSSDETPEIKSLKNTLSEVYNMSLDNIHITETE